MLADDVSNIEGLLVLDPGKLIVKIGGQGTAQLPALRHDAGDAAGVLVNIERGGTITAMQKKSMTRGVSQ